MRTILYLMIILIFACKTTIVDSKKDDVFDYFIIKTQHQNQWIDAEISLFHFNNRSETLYPIYLNFQEGDYLNCISNKKIYSTKVNYFAERIVYEDIDFLFLNPFPKRHKIKIKRKDITIEIYKIKVTGCISSWEDVGTTRAQKQEILLPFKMQSFEWNENEEKDILENSYLLNELFN